MAEGLSLTILAHLAGHRRVMDAVDALAPAIEQAARRLAQVLAAGGSVWLAGNGGSAADAQHLAAEMEGRLETERPARAVHTLTANSSTLTSVGNDYGFEQVFARQVAGFVRPGDLLWLISTSGVSPNLTAAARAARDKGVPVLGLLGKGGGPLAPLCDHSILVPADDTQWIQEAQIAIGHILCKLVDRLLAEARG
jgi:D-sedoheptulose 7-phosphate isomerase